MFKAKPQLTENESKELALDSYVTYVNHQRCITCGATETWSTCYEVWLHPTKTRTTNLRDLRPATVPMKPIPMARVVTDLKYVPVCLRCVDAYKVPDVGITAVRLTMEHWQETLKRKYAPPSAEPKVATKTTTTKPKKHIPTLDQI